MTIIGENATLGRTGARGEVVAVDEDRFVSGGHNNGVTLVRNYLRGAIENKVRSKDEKGDFGDVKSVWKRGRRSRGEPTLPY